MVRRSMIVWALSMACVSPAIAQVAPSVAEAADAADAQDADGGTIVVSASRIDRARSQTQAYGAGDHHAPYFGSEYIGAPIRNGRCVRRGYSSLII